MNRRARVVGAACAGLAVLVVWWLRGGGGAATPSTAQPSSDHRAAAMTAISRPRADPRTLARGSIRGTVRDEAGAPIAHARVCADAASPDLSDAATEAPACTDTGDQGRYQLAHLLAADYTVHAGARQFRPAAFHPTAGSKRLAFPLAAGEARASVDLVLRRGGVEITGVVLDIAGGAIAHARIRTSSESWSDLTGIAVDADEQGRFSLWADPGEIVVTASADGYAPNRTLGRAPGTFEILLTPESSLVGTVVDAATEQPVAGARVIVGTLDEANDRARVDVSDAQGKFRVEHLTPGRFVAVAATEHGYGRSQGSTLVGLGQHVEGISCELFWFAQRGELRVRR